MKYIVFFGLLLLISCQSQSEQNASAKAFEPVYFDLKGYFEQEVDRLENADMTVRKRVSVDDKSEEKELNSLDFAQELEVFTKSDINRPDWVGKYQVDSVFQNNELAKIEYQALDEQLRTRRINVEFANGSVAKIFVRNGGNSKVAGSEQELTYLPDSGYTIASRQYTVLAKDDHLQIEVRFGAN